MAAALEIEWPITAAPGQRPDEAQGDLVNAYATKIGDTIEFRRTPGTKLAVPLPDTVARVPRGTHYLPGYMIHVWDGELRIRRDADLVDSAATSALPGYTPVTMASNIRPDGPQTVVVTDLAAYQLEASSGTLTAYADTDLGPVSCVEYYAGYFFFGTYGGEIIASELQSVEVDGLSRARAEYSGDSLLRLKSTGNALLAMGSNSIEIWADNGGSPFPCIRQSALDVGLLGRWLVEGGVNVWGNGLLFVANDYTVRLMKGFDPVIVSNNDVVQDIYELRDDVEVLRTAVYNFAEHSIFSISAPDWTWEYNLTTGAWHRRESYDWPNWRGRHGVQSMNRWYVQDDKGLGMLEVARGIYDECGERMRYMIESKPAKSFPANIRIPTLYLDFVMALGVRGTPSPFQTNPVVEISWSHDGAKWSNPLTRNFGREGEYSKLMQVNGLGRSTARGIRIRLAVNDPVPAMLRGSLGKNASASRPRAVRM